jgi:poly(hydroxyalkanoate) depolymerase family esterase
MRKTLGGFLAQRRKWEKLVQAGNRTATAASEHVAPSSDLGEIRNFGSNPGALRMFAYRPSQVPAECALVVVLHGCAQTAAGYDLGAGWSTLADRYGFALLFPEQQRSNNPNGCFNWFQTGDIERGNGEALSIRQMVAKMVSDYGIDAARVFVTGLSAGGAMTSVMLATYPDVFAGGAIVAGMPYGAASNAQQAFETMFQCPPRSARAWGDLVRGASPHHGRWPRVSVWHGGADPTVIPANAKEIVKQWTDVHGLSLTPAMQMMADGYPRQVWVNRAGVELIESHTITNMAHGTPLATGEGDDRCGVAGPFLLDVGISSSYHIAKFFGLASTDLRAGAPTKSEISTILPEGRSVGRTAVAIADPNVLEGEVLDRDLDSNPTDTTVPAVSPMDIGAVITKALRSAGLMKGP